MVILLFFTELKCLQVILADESKALEEDCKSKLEKRIEMFRNAAPVSISLFLFGCYYVLPNLLIQMQFCFFVV